VEDQADALGLPVEFVVIPHQDNPPCPMVCTAPGTTFPPNDVYIRTMLAAWQRLKDEGIEVLVFGDIFLEDLRQFRDQLLGRAGLDGCYPLWGRDSAELYDEFIGLGFQAVIVCVDTLRLHAELCGQLLTSALRNSLPQGVDPCGERGEYHSFTFDGPFFGRPVAFRRGEIHRDPPFAFQELYPGHAIDQQGQSMHTPEFIC
jgi:diphthamide synthase (EF-2-diphthine--ammonia ligase)